MNLRIRYAFLFAFVLSLFSISLVTAQAESLELRMSRDWGYGGFNGDIQGLFTMKVTGPADMVRVEYFIDDIKIGEITKPPFNLQFNTDNYPVGVRQLHATGYSSSGKVYISNIISANFVPKQSSMNFVLPLLGVILAAVLLSALVPLLMNRGKRVSTPLGEERNYGIRGGVICPKCRRPFVLPLLSANLGFSKLAVCPYCGKWSLVRIASISRLREAEREELLLATSEKPPESSEDEKLREELDDSKFQN
jgi:hypothetical protein